MESIQQFILTLISEKGIIYGLFVFSFFMAIYKGIPYAISKFDAVVKQFVDSSERQHLNFQVELNKISETFITKLTLNDQWHRDHNNSLEGIRKILAERAHTSKK